MNPRYLLLPLIYLSYSFVAGQTTFSSTLVKLRGDKVRLIKIMTDDRLSPVLLVNESEGENSLADWYIFLENGGSISLFMHDSLGSFSGHAQLGQQSAQIRELGQLSNGDYQWQIATPADTLVLAGFNPDQDDEFVCLLYKQITQEVHTEEGMPLTMPKRKLVPLLRFSNTRARKSRLDIFETGQLSDYPYLAKIIGAFLATLKYSDRI